MLVELSDTAYTDPGDTAATRIETVMTTLDGWADAPTPLTFRCQYSPFDNKTVVLEPIGMRPILLNNTNQKEMHVGEITLLEI